MSKRLAPATVAECHRLLSTVLKSAVRDRIVGANPCEGVRLPKRRRKAGDDRIISREDLAVLLPTSLAAIGHPSASPPAPACAGVSAWACAGTPSASTPGPYGWNGSPSRRRAR
ncbi:hypothetical protein [Microbispora sp. H10830]|uniref:hypothetical protein n=1 Tax=Microbispora sp. H10830 TaxID=2729109 RepID=UPI001602AFF1|nr:hypothetical protein [Microbispora sp. H10830]